MAAEATAGAAGKQGAKEKELQRKARKKLNKQQRR